jgi:glyoxylase-like metal-dependent hydrolase (beta-lactamase superfamily II)
MNTYALIDPATNQSILFDPGADPDKLSAMLGDSTPIAIALTHTHIDHVMALDEMRQRLHVPVIGHTGNIDNGEPVDFDQSLEHGSTVVLGDHLLHVEYAPGHISNQICFRVDQRIIVGDTIFAGGPGKTWTKAGFQQTLDTLRTIVLNWPDDAHCYPGHGPTFRLGEIRAQVEAFVAKDHGDFFGDATWDQ